MTGLTARSFRDPQFALLDATFGLASENDGLLVAAALSAVTGLT